MKLRGVTLVNAAICLISAASAYRGADNRLVPGFPDERKFYDRRPPEIEYHYPDNISNKISQQHSNPSVSQSVYTHNNNNNNNNNNNEHPNQGQWHRQSPHNGHDTNQGPWRKTIPFVGYVNHIKPDRRKSTHRNTAGMYRSSQWGTARIPYMGATVNVIPASGGKKGYRGLVTTTVMSAEEARSNQYQPAAPVPAVDLNRGDPQDEPATPDPCYKCPLDRAVVAMKGTKYSPLEKPAIKPCHHRSWSPEVKLELTSGIRPGFHLSEGAHVITARLVYRQKTLEMCRFRYNVVVRRCPPLVLPDHLAANCSAENVWGSECQLSCRRGYQPLGPTTTECGDNQKWTQPLPHCITVSGCSLPSSPENGRLSCQTSDDHKGDLLGEGTTCRYVCNEGYSIPSTQHHLATVSCNAGEWNATVDPTCQEGLPTKSTPQVALSDMTDRKRHRKHRNGRPRSNDPCRPNPCDMGEQCLPGLQPFIALCSCPDNVPDMIDGKPCHKMVLVRRLMGSKDKRKYRDTLVLGNVYGITPNTGSEIEA